MKRTERRFWIKAGLAAGSALLLVLTLLWPAWIESVIGFDLDHSSGALEWSVVFALTVCTASFSILAGHEWRKHQSA